MSTEWQITPIGGLKRRRTYTVDRSVVAITLFGGGKADYSSIRFRKSGFRMTFVSLVGNVDIVVPRGVNVRVRNFRILGRRKIELAETPPAKAPTVTIRSFGLAGSIIVRTA